VDLGAAGGMADSLVGSTTAGSLAETGAGASGATATAGGVDCLLEPIECGSTPVMAATPTAEKRVTEIAAAVSSGWSRLELVISCMASFS
jgi:hypothetical protein